MLLAVRLASIAAVAPTLVPSSATSPSRDQARLVAQPQHHQEHRPHARHMALAEPRDHRVVENVSVAARIRV